MPPPSLPPSAQVIVVGGGCFGLSTTLALLRRGYRVTVFDRLPIPAVDAASSDINKAVRNDYGRDILYQHLADRALAQWRDWNVDYALRHPTSPHRLFYNTGILHLSRLPTGLAEYHATTVSALTHAGHGSTLDLHTSHDEIATKYPSFAASRSRFTAGYLNRGDGWCDSTRAVEYVRVLCEEKGAGFVVGGKAGMVTGFWEEEVEGRTRVRGVVTADGEKHAADLVVMATGAWSGKIVPGLEKLLKASGQAVVHLKIPKELIGKYGWEAMPSWNVDITSQGYYGFAANQDGIFKLAHHGAGYLNPIDIGRETPVSLPRTIVDYPNDTIPRDAVARFRAFLADVFPELAILDIIKTRMCWYTDTFDGSFLMDHHPDFDGLFVATGGSGHGMKFLPVLGEEVVSIMEGKPTPYAELWRWRAPVDNGKKESARMVESPRILQESEMAGTEDLKGEGCLKSE